MDTAPQGPERCSWSGEHHLHPTHCQKSGSSTEGESLEKLVATQKLLAVLFSFSIRSAGQEA